MKECGIYETYNLFYSLATKENSKGHASGGISLWISKKFQTTVIEITNMWIILKVENVEPKIILAALYLNPSYSMKTCIELLEDSLEKIENENPESAIILYGDLNSRTGMNQEEEEEDEIFFENTNLSSKRISLDTTVNDRGRQLNLLLEQHGLYILNGRTPGDIPGCHTFIRGKAKTVIDYFCTNITNLENVKKLEVLEMTTGADHFPLELTLNVSAEREEIHAKKTTKVKTTWLKWKEDETINYQNKIKAWTEKDQEIKIKEKGALQCTRFKKEIISAAVSLKMRQFSKSCKTEQRNK